MDELLNLIVNLPIPALTDNEWEILDDVFTSLPDKSTTGFAKKWEQLSAEHHGNPFNSVTSAEIFIYIEKWIKMANLLIKINRNLAATWLDVTKKQMDADALLELTINLLPTNTSTLKLCLANIDKASLLERKNQIGFALTNLYSAVSAKISEAETKILFLDPSIYEKEVKQVSAVIHQKYHINLLINLCEKYQKYLESSVEKIIKDNDTVGYNYYYHNLPRPANYSVISQMLASIDFECQNIPCKEAIVPIIKKYLLLQDFQHTLKRKHYTPEEKLIEFSEKFSNFESFISNPDNKAYFILKPFTEFIGFFNSFRHSHEEEFFKNIKLIVEEFKIKSEPQPLGSVAR